MPAYDSTLKFLLQSAERFTQFLLPEGEIVEWLNVEFPRMQQLRVDLLGRTAAGGLLQIELQSNNDSTMPLRMAEDGLAILRTLGLFPRQIGVYVGQDRLTMASRLTVPGLDFHFELIDIREVDSEPLLASPQVSDNVIGILGWVTDVEGTLRAVIARIVDLTPEQRVAYIRALLVVAGLRGWESKVEKEVSRVPVMINILDNAVIGPAYKRGIEEGKAEGLAEGLAEGRTEGERALLRLQIERRFGPIPAPARERLEHASAEQVERWALRILDAASLDDLLT